MIKFTSENNIWKPATDSDLFGFTGKNLTLDKTGYIRLSNSVRGALNSEQDADLDEVGAFIRSADHGFLAITDDQCFNIDPDKILGVLPTQNGDTNVPSGDTQSDAIFASGLLIVTQDNDVDYYSPTPNTWTDTNITLTATPGSQHALANFISLAAVAVADVNTIKLYASPFTATPTLIATLTIMADFYITGVVYFNQNIYIATINKFGGHAYLYVWNGYGTAAQSAYEVSTNVIYGLCVHKDSVHVWTGSGKLQRFNGSGFSDVAALPIFYSELNLSDEVNINMYKNCIKSSGDLIYINVSASSNIRKLTNQPDGIWCYDSDLDYFYHRYALSSSVVVMDDINTTDIDVSTNQITVSVAPITGTEALFNVNSWTLPAPLIDGQKYFVIKVDATHIKLALTKTLALAGTPIDITSQSNGTTRLIFFPNIDFGNYLVDSRARAILPIERTINQPQYGTDVLYGNTVPTRALGTVDVIGTTSTEVENRGYFVVQKTFSKGVEDVINKLTLKFSPFTSDLDKIIIKYRTVDDMRDYIEINGSDRWYATWTSATTFTTTERDLSTAIVGDEIEMLSGGGAGILAHITTITKIAGTYTVTIDESYEQYESGDKAYFVARNWKKLVAIAYGDEHASKGYYSEDLGVSGKFIQFKVEMRGKQILIEDFMADNKSLLKARA